MHFFPKEWERFISFVPVEHRISGDSIMNYYAKRIMCEDKEEACRHADEWTLWEHVLCSIEYDPIKLEKEVVGNEDNLAIARLETHYFLNKCFVPENYVFDNLSEIVHIPCNVVQGRFDFCTPPISSYDLSQAYGKNLNLTWTNSGHFRTDAQLKKTLKAIYAKL